MLCVPLTLWLKAVPFLAVLRTSCVLAVLHKDDLDNLRGQFSELDDAMTEVKTPRTPR